VSDDVRLGLIVGGVVAIVLALLWRFLVLHERHRKLRAGLEAPDPQDRARAGIVLADAGLHRSARTLLGHVARETDPRVCHAIALAVARRQWEPVNTLRVRQLREWASHELDRHGEGVSSFGPAVTRLSDMGGPRPPEADQAPAPGPVATPPTAPATAPVPEPAPEPEREPIPAASPPGEAGVSWRADST
jgi:hypothetical protein